MYTLNESTGIVTRDSDGVQVAPVDNPNNVNYLDYVAWIDAGNTPRIVCYPQNEICMKVSKLAFRNRFTIEEKIKIDMMSIDDPDASQQVRLVSAIIRVFFEDINQAEYILLNDEKTVAALNKMVEIGIISQARAIEISTTPPVDSEIPE